MSWEIEVFGKKTNTLNRGEKAAISRKLHLLDFDTTWYQNTVTVEGPYWGRAVEAINALGYETDEDLHEDDEEREYDLINIIDKVAQLENQKRVAEDAKWQEDHTNLDY